MVGMNVSGVVNGKELKLVAQEIFNKAKAPVLEEAAPKAAPAVKENPFSTLVGEMSTFMPQETKTAKTGFEQTTVQIDSGLQKMVNSQAAIDRYGLVAFKTPKKAVSDQPVLELSNGFEVSANKKDKEGKNPFAFFIALPKNADEALKDDKLESIFGSLVSQKARA
jgi:hypothetical protein